MTFCIFQNVTIDSDQTDDGDGGGHIATFSKL